MTMELLIIVECMFVCEGVRVCHCHPWSSWYTLSRLWDALQL